LSGDGTFSFATPIASGASYNVTVLTQPTSPYQSCTVASPTGIMPNGVMLAVNCVNIYSIGGTVSGLAGSLVLANNGGNFLPMSADGPFTFTTRIATGSSYAVTVSTQPAGQNCTVSSDSGIVSNADITDVTVTCPPLVTTTIVNENPSSSSTNNNSISFTLSSNYPGATFSCYLDAPPLAPCSSTPSYSGLPDGSHTFVVYASANGFTDAIGATHTWTVDTSPPSLGSISSSATGTTFTVDWTTNEPATTEFSWAVGNGTPTVLPEDMTLSTTHTVTITGLTNLTIYTFSVGGHDAATNEFWSARNGIRTGTGP
jgi:hypothetical protein